MDLNLRGRVALITASSSGLGRVIAENLAAEGVDVIINGRYDHTVYATVTDIRKKYGVSAYGYVADVTNVVEIGRLSQTINHIGGRLDILINNAGNIEKTGRFFELTDADWFRQIDLSFMSMVRFSREAYLWLSKSGHGRIINISSLVALQPNFNVTYWHYAAAKGAMHPVAKMLANEFGQNQITVNTICPSTLIGGGWHENVKRRAKREDITEEEAAAKTLYEKSKESPLGKVGRLEDVANLVTFLSSDKAHFLTGEIFTVDGGIRRSV